MDFFVQVTLLSAAAVVVVQEFFKLQVIPGSFANKYPVATNIVLSVIASIIASWKTAVNLVSWEQWVAFAATVAVVAAITYNQLVGKSAKLKSLEGPKV